MSRRPLVTFALVAAIAACGSQASAQAPSTPVPAPAAGKASMRVAGGVATKRIRYFTRGQTALVSGRVRPFVAGQRVTLHILRGKRTIARRNASVRAGRGGAGRYSVRFKAPGRGFLRLVVKHEPSAEQAAFRAPARRVQVVAWHAGAGSRGTKVLVMQRTLRSLGFATPVTGRYDAGTSRAVLAYRKTNHLGRSGFADRGVFSKLLRRRGAFRLRLRRAGRRHVEFDWSRQVLVLARNGRPFRTYHASSGAPATPTVFGSFRFYRKQPGTNAKGMVHSSYFIGGYAIHGYASVPNYPASHGCIRVPIPNARDIFDRIAFGDRVLVYR